ncbi:MAG: thiamine phosphate synthase [Candidatus Eremiobacteraeota bacterium]|nr:thiamine phosphate synthase [Candidatus Eremiobacteraeota bacterium]
MNTKLRGIYALVDPALCDDPERTAAALLRGGIRLVQYRSKQSCERAFVRRLHAMTSRSDALLIVNDDVEAAQDADGVHLGQEDIALIPGDLRRRLGGRLLGISCGVPAEAEAALRLGADYLGVGPFAITSSKVDAGPAIGSAGIASVVAAAGGLPVAAIGGIELDALEEVYASGASMAAVLSALVRVADPEAAAISFVTRWERIAR